MSKEAVNTELYTYQSPSVDILFRIYANDKYKARIYYMNEESKIFKKDRLVIFEEPNGDFNIVHFTRKYGISKTNIMYNREKRNFSIIKKGNKFYYSSGKTILPLTYNHLNSTTHTRLIINEMVKRLPWLRYMTEHNILRKVSFNTIYSKKLFSLEKALKYQFKLPLPTAKLLFANRNHDMRFEYLRYYLEYMDNVENLHNTLPNYDFGIFYDTVKMGKTLNKKVNCSWSPKRLKLEHDKWAKEITEVIFVDGNRNMSISDIYLRFSEESGFKILKTTKDMAYEGMVNKHCVATYISKVESGNCAIYHIDGYTLEVGYEWCKPKDNVNGHLTIPSKALVIKQFRGFGNCDAPKPLYDLVIEKLAKFNLIVDLVDTNDDNNTNLIDLNDFIIPF